MTRYSGLWRLAFAPPMLSSERNHERSVPTEPLAHELRSKNRDGVPCSGACSPARLSKHLEH
jgi:hypothetical protein